MRERNVDFTKYSSIKIGGVKSIKIAQTIEEVIELGKSHILIGKANNVLLSPKTNNLFMLGNNFDYIKDENEYVEVGGASDNRKLFLYCKENNIGGIEFLGSLPGSIGGTIKMNAGMKNYEICYSLVEVCIDGEWIKSSDILFEYRGSNINGSIMAARIKKNKPFDSNMDLMFKMMRRNQPKDPSLGSCFKNPKELPAGKLLDIVGLKGYRVGNMAFSNKHANFLINLGNGNFEDSIELINIAKDRVWNKYKIKLMNEIKIY